MAAPPTPYADVNSLSAAAFLSVALRSVALQAFDSYEATPLLWSSSEATPLLPTLLPTAKTAETPKTNSAGHAQHIESPVELGSSPMWGKLSEIGSTVGEMSLAPVGWR